MLKRLKTIALITFLIISFLLAPATTFAFADIAAHQYEEAILRLKEVGVLAGRGDGNFNPNDTLLRAEAAKVAAMFLGFSEADAEAAMAASVFDDVFAGMGEHGWAVGWINLVTGAGLIIGDGTGSYNPGDVLRKNEWITILLRLTGHEDAAMRQNWPAAYEDKALQLGLLETIVYSDGFSYITRGEMAQLAAAAVFEIVHQSTGKVLAAELFDTVISPQEFSLQGITIGDTLEEVLQKLGQPARRDLSKYGFIWYIYNQDYSNYMQVGIKNDEVVGLYSNAANWESEKGVRVGKTQAFVRERYGQPITYILKGNTRYNFNLAGQDLFLRGYYYLRFFYDLHAGNTVTAVQLIEKKTKGSLGGFHGPPSEELRQSFEKQIFDMANAVRARFGKPPFLWCEKAAAAARKHSLDMVADNFFCHTNLQGESPFERMQAGGIDYSGAGENIAGGQASAIFAHESWMNSLGHREGILGDFTYLGVGVAFGGSFRIYYTQKFYTPR